MGGKYYLPMPGQGFAVPYQPGASSQDVTTQLSNGLKPYGWTFNEKREGESALRLGLGGMSNEEKIEYLRKKGLIVQPAYFMGARDRLGRELDSAFDKTVSMIQGGYKGPNGEAPKMADVTEYFPDGDALVVLDPETKEAYYFDHPGTTAKDALDWGRNTAAAVAGTATELAVGGLAPPTGEGLLAAQGVKGLMTRSLANVGRAGVASAAGAITEGAVQGTVGLTTGAVDVNDAIDLAKREGSYALIGNMAGNLVLPGLASAVKGTLRGFGSRSFADMAKLIQQGEEMFGKDFVLTMSMVTDSGFWRSVEGLASKHPVTNQLWKTHLKGFHDALEGAIKQGTSVTGNNIDELFQVVGKDQVTFQQLGIEQYPVKPKMVRDMYWQDDSGVVDPGYLGEALRQQAKGDYVGADDRYTRVMRSGSYVENQHKHWAGRKKQLINTDVGNGQTLGEQPVALQNLADLLSDLQREGRFNIKTADPSRDWFLTALHNMTYKTGGNFETIAAYLQRIGSDYTELGVKDIADRLYGAVSKDLQMTAGTNNMGEQWIGYLQGAEDAMRLDRKVAALQNKMGSEIQAEFFEAASAGGGGADTEKFIALLSDMDRSDRSTVRKMWAQWVGTKNKGSMTPSTDPGGFNLRDWMQEWQGMNEGVKRALFQGDEEMARRWDTLAAFIEQTSPDMKVNTNPSFVLGMLVNPTGVDIPIGLSNQGTVGGALMYPAKLMAVRMMGRKLINNPDFVKWATSPAQLASYATIKNHSAGWTQFVGQQLGELNRLIERTDDPEMQRALADFGMMYADYSADAFEGPAAAQDNEVSMAIKNPRGLLAPPER